MVFRSSETLKSSRKTHDRSFIFLLALYLTSSIWSKHFMTPNVLIIQINITILTCYMVAFKPAGKIKYAEAPVLLRFFEQQLVSICEGMESSETHHGQDTV